MICLKMKKKSIKMVISKIKKCIDKQSLPIYIRKILVTV